MKILFLVARPTQFEAPLFRYAARDNGNTFKPLFWELRAATPAADHELDRQVDWGFDLFAGYPYAISPAAAGLAWIEAELDQGCDLLIINGYVSALCRAAARLARRRGIRSALRLDSVQFPGDPGPSLARRLFVRRFLGRRFERFLGTSSLTLQYLRSCGVALSRCGLFPYAVDHDHFLAAADRARPRRGEIRRQWGVPVDARVVLLVSKLHSRETPWDALRAAAALPADVHLVLAGDGPERAACEALAQTTPGQRIHFLGYAEYGRLPELYAAADLFVHVPREERWGVSVAEALATGLPAVTNTRVGAGIDLIAPGRNGFVVAPGSPGELAKAIADALALPGAAVAATNRERLAPWGYAATWRSLLAAAR